MKIFGKNRKTDRENENTEQYTADNAQMIDRPPKPWAMHMWCEYHHHHTYLSKSEMAPQPRAPYCVMGISCDFDTRKGVKDGEKDDRSSILFME